MWMKQRKIIEFEYEEKTVPTDICWMFMESKQWIWAQLSTEECISAMHSCQPLKWSSCNKIRELCLEENFDFSVLKLYYQYWDITKFMLGWFYKCSVKKRKTIKWKSARTCLTTIRLKVIVSWIASSLITRCSVTMMRLNQITVHVIGTCKFPIIEKVQYAAISKVFWDM